MSARAMKREVAIDPLVGLPLEVVERNLVLATLRRVGGNRTMAAQVLGISVRTVRNKLRDYRAAGYPVPASGPDEGEDA